MTKTFASILAIGFAAASFACSPDAEEDPGRLRRPTFVAAAADRVFTIDSRPAKLFAIDTTAGAYISLVDDVRLGLELFAERPDELLFSGLAVSADASVVAAAYTSGFGAREANLMLITLGTTLPPAEPPRRDIFDVSPAAMGPFATPGGEFLMITSEPNGGAVWSRYPSETTAPGPAAQRIAFGPQSQLVYAADWAGRQVHVLSWPGLAPVAVLPVDSPPLDVAVHPISGQVAVLMSDGLQLFAPAPEHDQLRRAPMTGLPWRVQYARIRDAEAVAVLSQDRGVYFFDTATACAIDADTRGFSIAEAMFQGVDQAGARIEQFTANRCPSDVPNQRWVLTWEETLFAGETTEAADRLTVDEAVAASLAVGDAVRIVLSEEEEHAATVTEIEGAAVVFAPALAEPAAGLPLEVRAAGVWTLRGERAGFVGRVPINEPYRDALLRVTVAGNPARLSAGERITFVSRNGVAPQWLAAAGFDMVEDGRQRFWVSMPDRGEMRSLGIQRVNDQWGFRRQHTFR
jgi:hypothetical protein